MALELGPELDEFVEKCVKTFAHWDLIVLLFQREELSKDVASIAKGVGRKEEEVREALEDLIEQNVAKKAEDSGYLLNPDYKEAASSFVEALKTREKRLIILTKVLEKGGS